jgi:hypothetical protein
MKTNQRSVLGWHFLAEDRRLRFGSREVVEAGKTYTAEEQLVVCQNGVHASNLAIDALRYAPGPVVCRVRLHGEIQHDTDKSVARHRTVLWMADATAILHEFALVCGEAALGQMAAVGKEPDPRSWAALDVKRLWLAGKATDEELAAAWAAARDAAWDPARDAAWATARGAAWAATWAAARDAAWDAARDAAWAAAWAAAWDAARDAAWAATWAAARDAAWDAARDAAWAAAWAATWAATEDAAWATARDAQNLILEQMLESLR